MRAGDDGKPACARSIIFKIFLRSNERATGDEAEIAIFE